MGIRNSKIHKFENNNNNNHHDNPAFKEDDDDFNVKLDTISTVSMALDLDDINNNYQNKQLLKKHEQPLNKMAKKNYFKQTAITSDPKMATTTNTAATTLIETKLSSNNAPKWMNNSQFKSIPMDNAELACCCQLLSHNSNNNYKNRFIPSGIYLSSIKITLIYH